MTRLLVWDLSAWVHRYWATMRGHAAFGVLQLMQRVHAADQVTHAVVCCDLPFPNWRHELAPGSYKADRGEKDPALQERLRWARELCEDVLGVVHFGVRGFEADDLIASVTKAALAAGADAVTIMGIDKDLMQLLGDPRVAMSDGKRLTLAADVLKKFSVPPEQLGDYLALVGDETDCVEGVRGIGPAGAVKLLEAYGSLDAALKEALGVKAVGLFKEQPRLRSALRAHAEEARLSRQLVTLRDDAPLPFSELEELRVHG